MTFEHGMELRADGTFWELYPLGPSIFHNLSFATVSESGWAFGATWLQQLEMENRRLRLADGRVITDAFGTRDDGLAVSVARRIDRVAFGITPKTTYQMRTEPTNVETRTNPPDETVNRRVQAGWHFDADLSASFEPSNFMRLGVAAHNIVGAQEIVGNRMVVDRAAGGGVLTMIGRLHTGLDVEYSTLLGWSGSYGLSLVPFDNSEVDFGVTTVERSLKLGVRYSAWTLSVRRYEAGRILVYSGVGARF
jgi:hypothetical protein